MGNVLNLPYWSQQYLLMDPQTSHQFAGLYHIAIWLQRKCPNSLARLKICFYWSHQCSLALKWSVIMQISTIFWLQQEIGFKSAFSQKLVNTSDCLIILPFWRGQHLTNYFNNFVTLKWLYSIFSPCELRTSMGGVKANRSHKKNKINKVPRQHCLSRSVIQNSTSAFPMSFKVVTCVVQHFAASCCCYSIWLCKLFSHFCGKKHLRRGLESDGTCYWYVSR